MKGAKWQFLHNFVDALVTSSDCSDLQCKGMVKRSNVEAAHLLSGPWLMMLSICVSNVPGTVGIHGTEIA